MKNIYSHLFISILITFILGNWSTDQTSVEVGGVKKNRVNFYGTLHTKNGEILSVENISIGHMFKQIPVYEKPKDTDSTLRSDPKNSIITKLDLSEIEEIKVPQPYTIMHYQKTNGAQKVNYITIKVTQKGQVNYYIIDTYRKLMCDQISPSGPIEKEVPFHSIDRIIIKGSKAREDIKKDETQAKNDACGCKK